MFVVWCVCVVLVFGVCLFVCLFVFVYMYIVRCCCLMCGVCRVF